MIIGARFRLEMKNDNILVEDIDQDQLSKKTVIIPNVAYDSLLMRFGVVLLAGEKVTQCKEGDLIYFSSQFALPTILDGEQYWVMPGNIITGIMTHKDGKEYKLDGKKIPYAERLKNQDSNKLVDLSGQKMN